MRKSLFFIVNFLALSLSILLYSCDPIGGNEFWIDNQSDSTLFISIKDKHESESLENQVIETNSLEIIYEYDDLNGLYDRGNEFLTDWCDSLCIEVDTARNIVIKKDYLNRENWEYRQHANGITSEGGNNIYTLTITNADL